MKNNIYVIARYAIDERGIACETPDTFLQVWSDFSDTYPVIYVWSQGIKSNCRFDKDTCYALVDRMKTPGDSLYQPDWHIKGLVAPIRAKEQS